MVILCAPAGYEAHSLDERVGVSARICRVLVGIVLVCGRALIGIARCVARIGRISTRVMRCGRRHAVDGTDVKQRRFLAAGIV